MQHDTHTNCRQPSIDICNCSDPRSVDAGSAIAMSPGKNNLCCKQSHHESTSSIEWVSINAHTHIKHSARTSPKQMTEIWTGVQVADAEADVRPAEELHAVHGGGPESRWLMSTCGGAPWYISHCACRPRWSQQTIACKPIHTSQVSECSGPHRCSIWRASQLARFCERARAENYED